MKPRFLGATIIGLLIGFSSSGQCADSLDTRSRDMPAPDYIRAMFPENWVDLVGNPCPTKIADYKRELAVGAIPPDRVRIGDTLVLTGMTESALLKALGETYGKSEPAAKRTKAESDQFISGLMQANATTTHYYRLLELAGMEGWFKAMEWDYPWGTLKAFLKTVKEKGTYRVYLIHTTLKGLSVDSVKLKNIGKDLVAIASSTPLIEWNTSRNILTIGGK